MYITIKITILFAPFPVILARAISFVSSLTHFLGEMVCQSAAQGLPKAAQMLKKISHLSGSLTQNERNLIWSHLSHWAKTKRMTKSGNLFWKYRWGPPGQQGTWMEVPIFCSWPRVQWPQLELSGWVAASLCRWQGVATGKIVATAVPATRKRCHCGKPNAAVPLFWESA